MKIADLPEYDSNSYDECATAMNQLLRNVASQLAEHFDSVQIVTTKLNPDGTTSWNTGGAGDYFARKEACREYVKVAI